MAAKKSIKRQQRKTNRNGTLSAVLQPDAKITPKAAMDFALRIQTTLAADAKRAKERAAIEAGKDRGIRLTRKQVEAATRVLSEANLAAIACVELARRAVVYPNKADVTFTAIEQMEMVNCRRLDAVARLLGDMGFGNFEGELSGDPAQFSPKL